MVPEPYPSNIIHHGPELTSSIVAQVAQAPPATTIVPFADIAKLPACATLCGPLFDANGACVPPAVPTGQPAGYLDCFCGDPRVSAFSSGTAGVCDTVCTAGGLESIANWFQGACSVKNAGGNKGSGGSNTAAGGQSGNTGGGGSVGAPTDGGGDWYVLTHRVLSLNRKRD